eukprot:scaffold16636_cov237-Amphora_coffeaeformis.AAC.2
MSSGSADNFRSYNIARTPDRSLQWQMANVMAVAVVLPYPQSIFGAVLPIDFITKGLSTLVRNLNGRSLRTAHGPSKRRRLRRPRRWSPCLGIGVLNGPSVEIFAPLPLDLCTSTVCTPTVWSHFQHQMYRTPWFSSLLYRSVQAASVRHQAGTESYYWQFRWRNITIISID